MTGSNIKMPTGRMMQNSCDQMFFMDESSWYLPIFDESGKRLRDLKIPYSYSKFVSPNSGYFEDDEFCVPYFRIHVKSEDFGICRMLIGHAYLKNDKVRDSAFSDAIYSDTIWKLIENTYQQKTQKRYAERKTAIKKQQSHQKLYSWETFRLGIERFYDVLDGFQGFDWLGNPHNTRLFREIEDSYYGWTPSAVLRYVLDSRYTILEHADRLAEMEDFVQCNCIKRYAIVNNSYIIFEDDRDAML